MNDADRLASKMLKLSKAYEAHVKDGVNEAATVLQLAAEVNLKGVTGGDGKLSGFKDKDGNPFKDPMKVGMLRSTSNKNSTAVVRGMPPGLFTIVERGSKPHVVGAKVQGKSRFNTKGSFLVTSLRTGETRIAKMGTRKDGSQFMRQRKFDRTNLRLNNGNWRRGPFPFAAGSPPKRPLGMAATRVGPRIPQIVQREGHKAIRQAGFK